MTGQVLALVVVIALIAVVSLWYRRADGAVRRIDATFDPDEMRALGLPPQRPALLLFTAPGCSPCTTARRVLDELGPRHNVEVVVADVTDHPAIASAQHVYRAPTVFLIDERGHAVSRISGVPRTDELEEALTSVAVAA